MSQKLVIKKGLDIKIAGAISPGSQVETVSPKSVAIYPDDFPGFTPKVEVKEGDEVKKGQPLLHDKRDESIKLVSPVAGTVKAILRGERRKIIRVEILPSASQDSIKFSKPTNETEARNLLKESGLWAMMRQRPYDIVPTGDSVPRDIFVTGFDSAPLADVSLPEISGLHEALESGVKLLGMLTKGKVYVSRRSSATLPDIKGAEMVDVEGPHPAGNAGVLIANIAPVNKGETVWTLDLNTLIRIGRVVTNDEISAKTYIAVTGSEVEKPTIVETSVGADIASILAGNVKNDGRNHRIIAGNVLTGVKVDMDGYIRYPYRQVTVIPEGDDVNEFMGWASISPKKMSESRSFPGKLFGKVFNPDARLLGGRRAFIMSGEYDKYMPMDIMSEYLLKAIMGRDIEQMEKLGIYEVAPEDFALGEYADTSKIEAQKIVREGLDYLRKELD